MPSAKRATRGGRGFTDRPSLRAPCLTPSPVLVESFSYRASQLTSKATKNKTPAIAASGTAPRRRLPWP